MYNSAREKIIANLETVAQDVRLLYEDLSRDTPRLARTAASHLGEGLYFVGDSLKASLVLYSFILFSILSLGLSYLCVYPWPRRAPKVHARKITHSRVGQGASFALASALRSFELIADITILLAEFSGIIIGVHYSAQLLAGITNINAQNAAILRDTYHHIITPMFFAAPAASLSWLRDTSRFLLFGRATTSRKDVSDCVLFVPKPIRGGLHSFIDRSPLPKRRLDRLASEDDVPRKRPRLTTRFTLPFTNAAMPFSRFVQKNAKLPLQDVVRDSADPSGTPTDAPGSSISSLGKRLRRQFDDLRGSFEDHRAEAFFESKALHDKLREAEELNERLAAELELERARSRAAEARVAELECDSSAREVPSGSTSAVARRRASAPPALLRRAAAEDSVDVLEELEGLGLSLDYETLSQGVQLHSGINILKTVVPPSSGSIPPAPPSYPKAAWLTDALRKLNMTVDTQAERDDDKNSRVILSPQSKSKQAMSPQINIFLAISLDSPGSSPRANRPASVGLNVWRRSLDLARST